MRLANHHLTRFFCLPLLAASLSTPALANSPTAQSILSAAEAQARQQHKNVLVSFGASWCGNCHLFDRLLADPTVGPLMASSFVHVELITGEQPSDTRHRNTPGGLAVQDEFGGRNAGWPYIAMLDPQGKLLADSFRPAHGKPHAENIGYPATSDEISWFIRMLQVSSDLDPAQLATVQNWLKTHSPTQH